MRSIGSPCVGRGPVGARTAPARIGDTHDQRGLLRRGEHDRPAEAGARGSFDRAVAESPGHEVHAFWPVYYTPFYRALGVPEDAIPQAIERTRIENDRGLGIWKIPVDSFDETMTALRLRELAVGIISNSDGRLEVRLEEIGIRDRFDFVIDSAVVGVSKPDSRIFAMALDAAGLEASQAVYVGDYYEVDVVGAREIGMTPVLFDPVGVYGDVDCDVIRGLDGVVALVDQWKDGA